MFAALKNFWKSLFPPQVVQVQAPPSVFEEPAKGQRELPSAESLGMVKLGVIVGHEKAAPGARMVQPYGLYEYAYNSEVAKEMKRIAPTGMVVEVILRDGVGISGAYAKARAAHCDAVIELHFNAFNNRTCGTETLCSPDVSDVDFAHIVHKEVTRFFGRQGKEDRGVKAISKSDRGGISVHSFPGGVNCLVEPFFGDALPDAKLAMDKRALYAKCLVNAVLLWAKKVDLIK